jgi:hypothetical protein
MRERRGCTSGNHLECFNACDRRNDVMRDAACSVSRKAVCERRCSTSCQREDCARTGRDRRPRRRCSPRRASRWRRLAALVARRRPTVARLHHPRTTSLLSRVKFVFRTTRCQERTNGGVLEAFRLKEYLRLAAGALFAKNTTEEVVPNGWRHPFEADTKHQITLVLSFAANGIAPRVDESFDVWWLRPAS